MPNDQTSKLCSSHLISGKKSIPTDCGETNASLQGSLGNSKGARSRVDSFRFRAGMTNDCKNRPTLSVTSPDPVSNTHVKTFFFLPNTQHSRGSTVSQASSFLVRLSCIDQFKPEWPRCPVGYRPQMGQTHRRLHL